MKRFPLATTTWDGAERAAIQRVVESGNYSMGREVAAFESAFASQVGSRFAVMVNSGSSANLLIVAALFYTKQDGLRLKRGDEVIVPAVSWSTTYTPLYQYGLKLKFVDIDAGTLNLDLARLDAAITPHTRAIFAVNLLGNPNDFAAIRQIVGGRDIVIVEDNCESLGATFRGQQAGTFGVMGSFSTFFSHHMATMEGGVVVTNDEELYHILLSLRAHGWTRNLPHENHVSGTKSLDPFEESYRFVLPGYNVRPIEMEAAVGLEQLKKLPGFIAARRANGALVQAALGNHPDIMIQQETGESSWFGFSIVPRRGSRVTRPMLIERLDGEGFEFRPIVAGNFVKNPVVAYFDHVIDGDLAAAEHIDRQGLFVGNHHFDLTEAVERLAVIATTL